MPGKTSDTETTTDGRHRTLFRSHSRNVSATSTLASVHSSDAAPAASNAARLSISSLSRRQKPLPQSVVASSSNPGRSRTPTNMATAASGFSRNQPTGQRPPGTSASMQSQLTGSTLVAAPSMPSTTGGSQNPQVTFQHIHETAAKRIATLDYLRKCHEGSTYWFQTLHYTKTSLPRLPYFEPRKLARRATSYLLLGYSLPTVLDLNSQTPVEYLRALNTLLIEFETYQSVHPPDGSAPSLTRARLPSMFKRAASASTYNKSRRASSAADIGFPPPSTGGSPSDEHGAVPADDLMPYESYSHLLTPSLPFDPDFFEVFATLCEVLIDAYTKILELISVPDACAPGSPVGELFGKADGKVRKILVAPLVREFEEAGRMGVKSEMAGVGKVVLGGLV